MESAEQKVSENTEKLGGKERKGDVKKRMQKISNEKFFLCGSRDKEIDQSRNEYFVFRPVKRDDHGTQNTHL